MCWKVGTSKCSLYWMRIQGFMHKKVIYIAVWYLQVYNISVWYTISSLY
jgi:hypothetical protein